MRTLLFLPLALITGHALAQRTAETEMADANLAFRDGQQDSALARVDRALQLDPALAEAYKLRGDIHQKRKAFDTALEDYNKAEDLDPSDARLYVSRSALRISEGNYKGAIRDCERAIELDPTEADAFNNRAWALYLTDAGDAALKDAIKAVRLRPTHAEAMYLCGIIKGERYNEEEGLADLDAALQLNPHLPGGVMSMAVLLYESQHYEKAVEKFNEVIASDTTELAAAHYYRGQSYYEMEDKENACKDFNKAARMGDKDAVFIKKNYCDTDATKIPRKPRKGARKTSIEF